MGGLSKMPHWIWYVAGAGAAIVVIIIVAMRGKASSSTSAPAATIIPAAGSPTNSASDSSNAISAMEAAMQQQNAAYEGILQSIPGLGLGNTGGTTSAGGSSSTPSPTLTVRPKTTSGAFAAYDANNSGVPVYANPADQQSVIGFAPFGQNESVQGNATAGFSAFGNDMYTPVQFGAQKGYISDLNLLGGGSTG